MLILNAPLVTTGARRRGVIIKLLEAAAQCGRSAGAVCLPHEQRNVAGFMYFSCLGS